MFLHKFPTTTRVTIPEQKFLVLPKGENDTYAKCKHLHYLNVITLFQDIFIEALKYKQYSLPSIYSCLFI